MKIRPRLVLSYRSRSTKSWLWLWRIRLPNRFYERSIYFPQNQVHMWSQKITKSTLLFLFRIITFQVRICSIDWKTGKTVLKLIQGYSKSVVDTISEADVEGNFWQAVAALNPSKRIVRLSRIQLRLTYFQANESLGFLEVEAEVINGKFVRQFDGEWVVLNDVSYDIFQDISEKHQNLMTVQGDASTRMLIKIGPEARNLEFGIFGVPDSEVFSDNVDHLSGQSLLCRKISVSIRNDLESILRRPHMASKLKKSK